MGVDFFMIEINTPGSTTFNIPSKLKRGMQLRFNVTNTDESTGYTGEYIPFTFPNKCTVKITAYGSRGSYGNLYRSGLTEQTRSGNGAKCVATFSFEKGDQLLMLIGQHGRDAMTTSNSTKDGTTGAGGGATFITKKVDSSSYKMVGHSDSNSTQFSSWYITPLIVAAGGNGSRDNGYSGTGTIYGGDVHTTDAEALGNSNNAKLVGGTLSKAIGTTSTNGTSYKYGLSFLNGGLGSKYRYTRSSKYALAGFGGGASNQDDGDGGGAGGWISGYAGSAAKSYIDTTLGTEYSSEADNNADDGYVIFEILKAGPELYACNSANNFVEADESYIYVNDDVKWKEIDTIYRYDDSGNWVELS